MKKIHDRRARERLETRLRILDAARELFALGGEEGLTLRRVADRIEYSATTIYLHFKNKEALVRDLCAADFAIFSRRLIQADRLTDPLERLRTVAGAYVDFGLQYPAQYRAMFITAGEPEREEPSPPPEAPTAEATRDSRTPTETAAGGRKEPSPQDFLEAAVFKGLAAGVFRPEYRELALITQTLWAGLHGVVALHQVRAKYPAVAWRPIQALTEMMIECLLHGMILPSLATESAWRKP